MMGTIKEICLVYRNQIIAVLIPIILLPLPVLANGDEKAMCGYALLWLSFYYIFQVIPLGISALLPLILFPMLGVLSSKETAASYSSEGLWVMFGTMICGAAFEKVGLHRRCAFAVLNTVGPKPTRLLWSFAFISFFISMLTTNVAATMAVLTIVDAMIKESQKVTEEIYYTNDIELEDEGENNSSIDQKQKNESDKPIDTEKTKETQLQDDKTDKVITLKQDTQVITEISIPDDVKSYTLKEIEKNSSQDLGYAIGNGVRFGCVLGGMASPMGSASNILTFELLSNCYEGSNTPAPLTFGTWLISMTPVCLIMLTVILLVVHVYYFGPRSLVCGTKGEMSGLDNINAVKKWIAKEKESMGKICYEEITLIIMFVLLVLLWFLLDPGLFPGWAHLPFFKEGYIGTAVATILVAMPLFILPSKPPICINSGQMYSDSTEATAPIKTVMDWPTVKYHTPWQMPLLFGAGLAAAEGAKASGLDDWLTEQFEKLTHLDPATLVFVFCIFAAFGTEILSSNLMLNILIPVMCSLSVTLGKSPLYFAMPVAFSISTNFMMPNQPVNTLTLEFGKTTVLQLLASGFVADILFVCIMTFASLTWFKPLFDLDTPPLYDAVNITTASPDYADRFVKMGYS